MRPRPAARFGSAPAEVLVAVALGGAVAGLVLPGVQKAREAANRAVCHDNLARIGRACLDYEAAHRECPRHAYAPFYDDPVSEYGYGIGVALLPHLGRADLHKLYDPRRDWWDDANQPAVKQRVAVFTCPSAPPVTVTGLEERVENQWASENTKRATTADYQPTIFSGYVGESGAYGVGAFFVDDDSFEGFTKPTLSMMTDGLSNTIALAERAAASQHWIKGKKVADTNGWDGQPRGLSSFWPAWTSAAGFNFNPDGTETAGGVVGPCTVNCNNAGGLYAFHAGGANVVFLDGSVRFLKEGTDPYVLAALVSRASGEVVGTGDY